MTNSFEQLEKLMADIATRAKSSPDTSYTAQLLSKGVGKCAKKFGEEALELALAAVAGNKTEVAAEAADVLYHLLVLLRSAGVSGDDVMAELKRRQGMSGLAEKAARGHD
jgi:phosphoribosyl-ATP pyrophosphohydrolase